jgi:hypothetical protein
MFQFLRRLCNGSSRVRPRTAAVHGRQFRPQLEPLEDRFAPAVFNVNSTADILSPPAGVVTLRSAIEAADAVGGGNTINLTVAGNYQIALPGILGAVKNAASALAFLAAGNLTIQVTSLGTVTVDGIRLSPVLDFTIGNAIVTAGGDGDGQAVTFPNPLAQPISASPPAVVAGPALAAPAARLVVPFSLPTPADGRSALDDILPNLVPAVPRPMPPDLGEDGATAERLRPQVPHQAVSTIASADVPPRVAGEGVPARARPVQTGDEHDFRRLGDVERFTATAAGNGDGTTAFAGVVLTLLVGGACGIGTKDRPGRLYGRAEAFQ